MDLKKLYFQALRRGIELHPEAPAQRHRAFASAVAQLCGDDPREPMNKRLRSLMDLYKVSGGPSCREHACLWAAYGRGDAIATEWEGMRAFQLDERFQFPGTWDMEFAIAFCDAIAFGSITALHREVWAKEPNCFDDAPEDIAKLKS